MKRMWLISWICLMVLCGPARSQGWALELGAGLSSSRMGDLKYLHENILSLYPVPGKILTSFPPYTNFTVGFRKELYPSVFLGGGYQFASTGARSDYTDYSGSISSNITTTSHRLGAAVSYALLENDWLGLSAFGRADVNYTQAAFATNIHALGLSDGNYYKYYSLSPILSAGAECLFHLDIFSIGLEASYLADLGGELKDVESGNPLTDPQDRDKVLTTDWTGWRAMLKVLFWLQ